MPKPKETDPWEQRKLGEEFERVNERNDGSFGREHWISVAKMYFQDPEMVQSNNIDTRTYVMRKGDIAFEGHPNAEYAYGRFVVNDIGDGVISELFPVYRHIAAYDINYWKYAIQLEWVMAPVFAKSITSSGNSSNKLDPKHFLKQSILVPSLPEQREIGSFFHDLDSLITLHQRKCDNAFQDGDRSADLLCCLQIVKNARRNRSKTYCFCCGNVRRNRRWCLFLCQRKPAFLLEGDAI